MAEDEHVRAENEEAPDEVEAHRHKLYGNEEPAAEGESDDDVEAHRHKLYGNAEPAAEGESDDDNDVEGHAHRMTAPKES